MNKTPPAPPSLSPSPPPPLVWRVAPHDSRDDTPSDWIPAVVPGAVQLDWARAQGWPEYWKHENVRAYDGLEDRFWTHETCFETPALANGARLFFTCGGIDYAFEIIFNGETVHEQEGMFTPVDLEITERVRAGAGNVLRVRVHPAPKSAPAPAGRAQANRSCKPAMSYGWDFHPRLIPLGIWREARLEIRPNCFLRAAVVDCELSADFSKAGVTVSITLDAVSAQIIAIRWTLRSPEGRNLFCEKHTCPVKALHAPTPTHTLTLAREVARPALWWPHDQGAPALHTSLVELLDARGNVIDSRTQRIGFRRVRLVMAPGQWHWRDTFPKTRSLPPMTLEINGRAIFAKGANWVSPEIFPGKLSKETCDSLLQLARGAHMNILRMWGGAPAQKDFFYEKCDELGIMVWQEFPLACNCYPDDPAYLRVLDQESRSLIARLKPRACVIMWCGGNELFNNWSGMTDQALPLRLLAANCYQLDPQRPFLPTSPVEGVAHGHYVFRDSETGVEAWAMYQKSDNTAYAEFGVPAPAPEEILREIIPENELLPPRHDGAWAMHHALGAWLDGSHLYPETLEHYFGPTETFAQLVERGQLLQSEGLKGIYEEARRQKPRASMALCWCFNEPWPAAANLSIVSWPARPKPALAAVADACRPFLASARIRKFRWHAGEIFDPQLWWLNDTPAALAPGPLRALIEYGDGKTIELLTWHAEPLRPNTNLPGPQIAWPVPALESARFTLILSPPKTPAAASRYTLLYD
jgi:beta-mannosidase